MKVKAEYGTIQIRVVDKIPDEDIWDVAVKAGEGRYVLVTFEPEEGKDEEKAE